MKFTMEVKKEYDVRVLEVVAGVRYWENGEVNGKEDTNGEIPCRVGENWEIKINIETGQILNWEKGNTAKVHYKVCDAGSYTLINEKGEYILEIDDAYVPSCLSIDDNGYGDYIIMAIDENGFIKNWDFTLEGFISEDDE